MLLTRHLLDAGHRVIATDASPAMVELARQYRHPVLDSGSGAVRPGNHDVPRQEDGSWRRDDERHENVLLDTGGDSGAPGRAGGRG